MPVAPKSTQDLEPSLSVPDAGLVREQLERLLAHPLFANSKRYPALLAYVVEQTLQGNAADLKERSIGIEVFNRAPTYDANADPVVRITAGEVRKRLSQYYYDSAHDGELVIELPTGSYVPVFHAPEVETEVDAALPAGAVAAPETVPASPPPPVVPPEAMPEPRHRGLRWLWISAAMVLSAAIGLVVGLRHHPPPAPPAPPSNIDRFWEPVTSSANPATFCLGEPAKNLNTDSLDNFDAPVSKPEP